MKLKTILIENTAKLIALDVFKKISNELDSKFNEGYATCTFATLELGKAFEQAGINFKVISGEYNQSGHYWIEDSFGNIFDLGNNVVDSSIESGHITPMINKDKSLYDKETSMSFKQYLRLYNQIKNY
jgi:hypothetical protein